MRRARLLVAPLAATAFMMAVAVPAMAQQYPESALVAAGVLSKAQAEAIALQDVQTLSGTAARVIGARFEGRDAPPHWSVDLVTAKYDWEVWVSTAGRCCGPSANRAEATEERWRGAPPFVHAGTGARHAGPVSWSGCW